MIETILKDNESITLKYLMHTVTITKVERWMGYNITVDGITLTGIWSYEYDRDTDSFSIYGIGHRIAEISNIRQKAYLSWLVEVIQEYIPDKWFKKGNNHD